MKKLRNMQIFSKLVVTTPITTICLLMRNFITNFVRILGICKDFAGNRVNELGITAEPYWPQASMTSITSRMYVGNTATV